MGIRLRWAGAGVLVAAVWMVAYNLPMADALAFAVVGGAGIAAGFLIGAFTHD